MNLLENATSPYIKEQNKENVEKFDKEIAKAFTKEEKKLLLELICNEQVHMIIKDHSKYESEKYVKLEELKIKIKDM